MTCCADIDLDFRPDSYFTGIPPLARVEGTARRHQALAAIKEGSTPDPELLQPRLTEDQLQGLTRLDPFMASGEDLDDLLDGEVEIARTHWTKTIHGEVVSIRARRDGDRIRYRVVDEHQHWFEVPEDLAVTELPLTLRQLLRVLDETRTEFPCDGLYLSVLRFLHEDCDSSPDELRGYIELGSRFYDPHLSAWSKAEFEKWYRSVTRRA